MISSLLALALMGASQSQTGSATKEEKIPLTPSMVVNETGFGDASLLVDEQNEVGDPASGHGKAPTRPFFPGWTAWIYPVSVDIDLGAKYHVTRLYFYNATGINPIMVSTGSPAAWSSKPVTIDAYITWQEVPVNADTRWLRITLNQAASLPEMVAYGIPLEPVRATLKKTLKPRRLPPTMDQLIGVNGFIDDPIQTIATPAGFLREYHNWSWDVEAADHKRRFQPSAAGGGWLFDDFYAKLKAKGVVVCPAIQGNVPEITGSTSVQAKPIKPDAYSESPAAYKVHAAHLFQWAARYGRTKVADELLQLAPGQPRVSGLGTLQYLENGNEDDNTWTGREGRFNPFELAAMCSADYDGDKGKLGPGYGIKTADPNMKLVLAGLSNPSIEYLRAMKLWADTFRGGEFPADVINVHHYSNSGVGEQWVWGGHGISPEEDHLREKMAAFADWRDANIPDREVWLTEFGYDTSPASPIHAAAVGSMSAEQVQAAWLVRSLLALAAARIDKAAIFMLRDTKDNGTGVFETCGLVTQKGEWTPKASYFEVSALKNRLTGMRFDAELPTQTADVMVYRFRAAKGSKVAYAVWCPTDQDKHIPDFHLALRGKSATVVSLSGTSVTGTAMDQPVENGELTLHVSETPVLVLPN